TAIDAFIPSPQYSALGGPCHGNDRPHAISPTGTADTCEAQTNASTESTPAVAATAGRRSARKNGSMTTMPLTIDTMMNTCWAPLVPIHGINTSPVTS